MLRLTARYGQRTRSFPLPAAGRARLGSSRDNDIVLPYPGVSREHALLLRKADELILRDLGSKNGLLCDGQKVGEVALTPGRAVQVGSGFVTLEELPSSDGVLALAFSESRSASTTGTVTTHLETLLGGPSAGQILRFVERLLDGLSGADDSPGPLAEAPGLLNADAVVVGHLDDDGRLVVREGHGALEEALLRSLEESLSSNPADGPPEEAATGRGRWLLRSLGEGKGRAVLGAHFPPGLPAPWARDLFLFVARRLGATPVAGPRDLGNPRTGALDPPPGMSLGGSPAMAKFLEDLRPALASPIDVLLLGETGTGKELFARLIHRSGPRSRGPFVAVNCAAIAPGQLEAELFGIGRRIATEVDARPGLFLQADGGTLLLDEIGELPEQLQAKLLRVVQEREVRPVGSAEPRKLSLRLIAASNRNLPAMVRDGRFRADLYYRLQQLELHLPPLRERREEIPELVTAFARASAALGGKRIRGVTRRALDRLLTHAWPGNIRQLKSAVERAVALCPDGGALESRHFDLEETPAGPASRTASAEGSASAPEPTPRPVEPRSIRPLRERLEEEERRAILEALAASRGNKTQAARLLGISRPGLAMKIERLGIEP